MSLPLLFGTLFRLAGVDVSVFPDARGRFGFDAATCAAIRERLAAPLGELAPAWPCPAGGLPFEGLGAACAEYGPDTVLLVGGALLGHAPRVEDGTRAFAEGIAGCFPGHRIEPAAREEPPAGPELLPFRPEFEWGGAGECSLPDGGGRFGPRSVPGGPPGRARRPLRRADPE